MNNAASITLSPTCPKILKSSEGNPIKVNKYMKNNVIDEMNIKIIKDVISFCFLLNKNIIPKIKQRITNRLKILPIFLRENSFNVRP